MNEKVVIQTDGAPAPVGPYSQAVKFGKMLFLAGQIGLDPKTGKMAGPDTVSQAKQIFKNIEAILKFAGVTFGHVGRCVVYVVDLNEMKDINKIYAEHFIFEPPARTTIQVAALPGGARIEIEATVILPGHIVG